LNLDDIIRKLDLEILTETKSFPNEIPSGGYTSDLLSCVMAGAKQQNLWITLQAHSNIVAIAALLDLSAIIITEGARPDNATINKANAEKIVILGTKETTYFIVGKLWSMGLK
jgi:serine kinase of HPr protein (carbohydrate metabolism regulator)